MAELPFLPIATDAYLADCDHLTDAEHGRYFLILMALWRAPMQRLPNDDEWLARKFRRSVEAVQAELRPLIKEFCQCDGNWITQKRLSKEFKRARKSVNQRSAAAKSRWRKEKDGSGRTTNTPSGRNAPTPTPTPTPIEEEKTLSQGGQAQPFPPDWQPSEDLLERARKLRPDIQPARLKLETQGFISRKRADNRHSFNWDEEFIGWIIKTKIEEHRSNGNATPRTGQTRGAANFETRAAYAASLSRAGRPRSSDDGGRDRRTEDPEASDMAAVDDPGEGPAQ